MLKYFRELLLTLKSIEQHLGRISSCVKDTTRHHGDKHSISTKHWNDS